MKDFRRIIEVQMQHLGERWHRWLIRCPHHERGDPVLGQNHFTVLPHLSPVVSCNISVLSDERLIQQR